MGRTEGIAQFNGRIAIDGDPYFQQGLQSNSSSDYWPRPGQRGLLPASLRAELPESRDFESVRLVLRAPPWQCSKVPAMSAL